MAFANALIVVRSAVVTVYGLVINGIWSHIVVTTLRFTRCCQQQGLEHVPNSILDVSINSCVLSVSETATVVGKQSEGLR